MSLGDLLLDAYGWADERAAALLVGALAIPLFGTIAAWVGKAGRTTRDGRLIASLLVGFGIFVILAEEVAILVAQIAFEQSVLAANVIVLSAPIVCLAGCLLGVHLLFPLNELGSVRTCADVGLFMVACAVVLWVVSQFRGWGILFWGGIGQLLVIGVIAVFLLRRLYLRAVGRRR